MFLSRPTFNYRRDTVDREVGFLGHEQAGIFAVLIVVDVDRDIGREFSRSRDRSSYRPAAEPKSATWPICPGPRST